MDHKHLLKTLLQEIKDGVIVCEPDATISLFNPAAEGLFGRDQLLRRGISLFTLCFQPPVEQALNLLRYQHELKNQTAPLAFVQFMNTDTAQEKFFRCRVSLLPRLAEQKNSFVVIFEDISAWYNPANPLFMKIEEFRAPMTNLRASIENLTEYPEMSPVMRSAFENVLVQESLNLTEAFDSLAGSCKVLMQTQNHLAELSTEILFGYVAQHLRLKKISLKASPGQAITARVDIYGLLLVLDHLVSEILQKHKGTGPSCKAHTGEQFVYFDILWPGEPMATGAVKSMLEKRLEHSLGGVTMAAILHAMDGDVWSQQIENSQNMLRLALPITGRHGL